MKCFVFLYIIIPIHDFFISQILLSAFPLVVMSLMICVIAAIPILARSRPSPSTTCCPVKQAYLRTQLKVRCDIALDLAACKHYFKLACPSLNLHDQPSINCFVAHAEVPVCVSFGCEIVDDRCQCKYNESCPMTSFSYSTLDECENAMKCKLCQIESAFSAWPIDSFSCKPGWQYVTIGVVGYLRTQGVLLLRRSLVY